MEIVLANGGVSKLIFKEKNNKERVGGVVLLLSLYVIVIYFRCRTPM